MFKIYNGNKFPIWSDGERFTCQVTYIGRPMVLTMESKYGALKIRDPQEWVDRIASRLRQIEVEMTYEEFYDVIEIALELLFTCSTLYEKFTEESLDTQ